MTGITLGSVFGFGLYYGNQLFYLPRLNSTYSWACSNALLNLFCVKNRTIQNINDSEVTLTASNAYFHQFMAPNITDELNYYPMGSSLDTCMWSAWAVDLQKTQTINVVVNLNASSDYNLELALVYMTSNQIVAQTREFGLALNTYIWDLSNVLSGKYMLRLKNTVAHANFKVQSVILIRK